MWVSTMSLPLLFLPLNNSPVSTREISLSQEGSVSAACELISSKGQTSFINTHYQMSMSFKFYVDVMCNLFYQPDWI